jgi:DNA-binding LacI/PurR family transcriptional regulator
MPPAARRITLADIAREVGVSRATVSYVLNDTPGHAIPESTRTLVRETASRLGHVPNASARALRLGRSRIVLALLPNFSRGYVAESILESLNDALADRGYALAAHHYDESRRSLSELWGMISPDVVVALSGLSVPDEAVIEQAESRLVRLESAVDHTAAGRLQVQHLLNRGHRRLGYLYPSDPTLASVAGRRLAGARAAARDAGVGDLVVATIAPSRGEAGPALDRWVAEGVTAVSAHNDLLASMVLLEMGQRGLRAPDDLAIIGADDAPVARGVLTTVAIDIQEYAAFAVESVFRALDNDRRPVEHGSLIRLVERRTT